MSHRTADLARRICVALLSLTLLALLGAGRLAADPPGYEGRTWRLVFGDEFDGASLDTTKWSHHYPWGRTHNHDAYSRSGNVTLEDGKLVLTAREESFGGKPYTTGVVHTNGKFRARYGYFEARLRMPSTVGSWPAFWMLQDGWPPEIDIMEFPLADVSRDHNEKYRYWWNYHWGTVSDHRSAGSEEWQGADLTQGFHLYAVEWSPDAMRFYLDGELRGTVTNRAAIAESGAMYMILNYAVGGWPGSPPSWPAAGDRYEIDWVRVWQLEEPDGRVDLGNVVGGGSGSATSSAPHVGIHPATGAFSSDLGLDAVSPQGASPDPVASAYVDSVFLIDRERVVIDSAGTVFEFPSGDTNAGTWDLISNAYEPGTADGFLRLGPKGVFLRGVGLHASAGVTFDLDALRRRHGDRSTRFFSAFAGEGDLQAGGSVRSWAILSSARGEALHSLAAGPSTDDGVLLELELPREARFLTLATGAAGDGIGQDHGVFADAFLTPTRRSDPGLELEPADEMLVFSGSTWSYRDSGQPPTDAWSLPGASAAGWRSGQAPLGYGDENLRTEVSFGGDPDRKHITTWFRRAFRVADASGVTGLSLRLLRDDGALVRLNGVEVLRSNLPAGAVSADTLAASSVAGADETSWIEASVDPCLLEEGLNVIAVEIHQRSETSSDIRFDLALAAERSDEAPSPCGLRFVRGDCNGDGDTSGVADAVFHLAYHFTGGRPPPCAAACDTNGDGAIIGVSDAVALLQYNFGGGRPPAAPFPRCGPDSVPSDLTLGCDTVPPRCSGE